jgi:hypothetical protein
MNRTALILLMALIICGCKSPYQPTEFAPTPTSRRVKIETDPSGMRIYFGIAGTDVRAKQQREFVGTSPCVLEVECDEEGRFINRVSSLSRPVAIFYAVPPSEMTNLFAQEQTFVVPAMFIRPPPIPRAVFFDMRKSP